MNTAKILRVIGGIAIAIWGITLFVSATGIYNMHAELGIRRAWVTLPLLLLTMVCFGVAGRMDRRE